MDVIFFKHWDIKKIFRHFINFQNIVRYFKNYIYALRRKNSRKHYVLYKVWENSYIFFLKEEGGIFSDKKKMYLKYISRLVVSRYIRIKSIIIYECSIY